MDFGDEALLSEIMDLIDEEIITQNKKNDVFDVTGKIKEGKIQGLEIAKKIVKELYDEWC